MRPLKEQGRSVQFGLEITKKKRKRTKAQAQKQVS